MNCTQRASKRGAFTRTELLATLGTLAVSIPLLSTCGNSTRVAAEAAGCADNLRHLGRAWMDHATDNPFLLGNPSTGFPDDVLRSGAWAAGWLNWQQDAANTNAALLRMPAFVPYAGTNTAVFRCPSDRFVSSAQRNLGWRHRSRTYSMNSYVGLNSQPWDSSFRQFSRHSDFIRPSGTFVFVEEHPDSLNDPWFAVYPTGRTVPDLPGSLHNRGANLSFADGHVERHAWRGGRFVRPVTYQLVSISGPADEDSLWLGQRASQRLP